MNRGAVAGVAADVRSESPSTEFLWPAHVAYTAKSDRTMPPNGTAAMVRIDRSRFTERGNPVNPANKQHALFIDFRIAKCIGARVAGVLGPDTV